MNVAMRQALFRNFVRAGLIHLAVVALLVGAGAVGGCLQRRTPVIVPVEFSVETPSSASPPEPSLAPEPEKPRPPEPEPKTVVVPPEAPKTPEPPKSEKPKTSPRTASTTVQKPVATQRVARVTSSRSTRPRPMTEEEIRRWLAAGATPSDRTSLPGDDERAIALIHRVLYSAWEPPSRAVAGEAAAVVELTLAMDGRVVAKRLLTPSGNPAMDASVEAALQRIRVISGLSLDFLRRHPVVMVTFRLE